MAAGIKSFSKTFVWIILGLLIAGLAGFGATNLSGTVRTVATVGSQSISVDDYARDVQRVYYAGQVISGADAATFSVEGSSLSQTARDSKRGYRAGKPVR